MNLLFMLRSSSYSEIPLSSSYRSFFIPNTSSLSPLEIKFFIIILFHKKNGITTLREYLLKWFMAFTKQHGFVKSATIYFLCVVYTFQYRSTCITLHDTLEFIVLVFKYCEFQVLHLFCEFFRQMHWMIITFHTF